jgi:hypothetical protein
VTVSIRYIREQSLEAVVPHRLLLPLLLGLLVAASWYFVSRATRPEESEATRERERTIREVVCGRQPVVQSVPSQLLDEIVLPDVLISAHKEAPQATLKALLKIVEDEKADDSVAAAAYAFALLDGPAVGVVCLEHYDRVSYDKVDRDWGCTPREHWLQKLQGRTGKSE